MVDGIHLKDREKQVMKYLDKIGYDSPVRVQIQFGWSRQKVFQTLDFLARAGYIERPQQGLILSRAWMNKNPHKVAEISMVLRINLVG